MLNILFRKREDSNSGQLVFIAILRIVVICFYACVKTLWCVFLWGREHEFGSSKYIEHPSVNGRPNAYEGYLYHLFAFGASRSKVMLFSVIHSTIDSFAFLLLNFIIN